MSSDSFAELESLLLDWEEGTLSETGLQQLRQILRDDEAARAHYLRLQMISAAMHLDGSAGLSVPESPQIQNQIPPTRPRNERRKVSFSPLTLAVVVVLVGLVTHWVHLEFSQTGDAPLQTAVVGTTPEATSRGVAVVTRLVDVAWEEGQKRIEAGDSLAPGRVIIPSGVAQIEFFCGATVIVEGPAELDLKSAKLATVYRGRLRASVPPAARGFTLNVNDMKVVDLGTEFGISVSDAGTNVHVFDGEIELQRPKAEAKRFLTGEGLHRSADGEIKTNTSSSSVFVDMAALQSRSKGQTGRRFNRWRTWSERLRQDANLITYFAFDEPVDESRRLANSLQPANTELDGAIVGANRVDGRWTEKSALEFKRPGDRVRIHIPGEFGSLTLACWVKIDSLDRRFNSLFLTDNYNKGEPHWQILESGQLYFSVRPRERNEPGPRDFKALSPPFWNPSLSGRWLHLATVYSIEAETVSHFLNGEILSTVDVPAAQMVKSTRIGTASIGNWSIPTMPDSGFAIRNLNGSIDEFALFSAALSGEEIREIYENGKP